MKIIEHLQINTHYTRSVNIERDAHSAEVVASYIPTSRALRTLERVMPALRADIAPRAWSLVGPYGSGKSAFSLFVSALLGDATDPATKAARKVLANAAPEFSKSCGDILKSNQGCLRVLITGSPEPLGVRLLQGFAEAAAAFWKGRRGKRPVVLEKLNRRAQSGSCSGSELIALVQELQKAIAKATAGTANIVLIIDELGKFLDYEARHYGANDIFLLQSLAELACKANETRILLFVLLHQSFEQYAKGLGENLKKEWAKIQGRFEDIPFLESAEQTLRIVAAAVRRKLPVQAQRTIAKDTEAAVAHMFEQSALPSAMTVEEANVLFDACYPLHPVTAILLPLICQKVAQNERTLFSYLGSQEPHGFIDIVSRFVSVSERVLPHHVYDYFIVNQPVATGDHITSRRWAEVVTALERLGDAPLEQINLLKTIGVLNIIGSKGGFKASPELLAICIGEPKKYPSAMRALEAASIINFRRFNREYRVWQGSDFDLEEALEQETQNVGNFSIAEQLNARKSLLPVVARKYTIINGALRYFLPQFVDAQTFRSLPSRTDESRIIFFLAHAKDDEDVFRDEAVSWFSDLDVVALNRSGQQIREALTEVIALERIRAYQALAADPIAKREFEERFATAESSEADLVRVLIEKPEESEWYWSDGRLDIHSRRSFQEEISRVLAIVYCKAPEIRNELINRDRPSSQAAAARNKLLAAMLQGASEADLGIGKFPPEKAIYRSVLHQTGVHREVEFNRWSFQAPHSESSMCAVWRRLEEFVKTTSQSARSFAELSDELRAPPYGMRDGVLPIIIAAFYFANQDELALYEERAYRPYFTVEMLERFVKRPDQFSFQQFKIDGVRASIFAQYEKALFGSPAKRTIVDLVRPLAKFIGDLDEYTRRTKSTDLSNEAKRVRDAFFFSKSPEKLLFNDLPAALGYEFNSKTGRNFEDFAAKLQQAIRELKHSLTNLIAHERRLLGKAFRDERSSLGELRQKLAGRYTGLDQLTVDVDGTRAFLKRLVKRDGSDDEWFANILMFLGGKPTDKWSDTDRTEAELRLIEYSKRILDLEALRLHYDRTSAVTTGDFEVILLKSLKKGEDPIEEVVAIDETRREAVDKIKMELATILDQYQDDELKLAVVAETVDEFLKGYRNRMTSVAERKLTARRRAHE